MCFITLSLLLLLMSCLPSLCCCRLSTFISSFCCLSSISILGVLFTGYLQPERYRQSRFFYFIITQNISPLVSEEKNATLTLRNYYPSFHYSSPQIQKKHTSVPALLLLLAAPSSSGSRRLSIPTPLMLRIA